MSNRLEMAQQQKPATEQLGLRTAPFDARFPNQNQTKSCWQNYLDYQHCIKNKGEEFEPCRFFKKNFRSLCPVAWVSSAQCRVQYGILFFESLVYVLIISVAYNVVVFLSKDSSFVTNWFWFYWLFLMYHN